MSHLPDIDLAGGCVVEPLSSADIGSLEAALDAAGLDPRSTRDRYAVVFLYPGMGVGDVYPELAGCTREVCTFIEQAALFAKHGVGVTGLSGEATEPPASCVAIPFPVGIVPQRQLEGGLAAVERDGRRYVVRATFVRFPDGEGVHISGIANVVDHVRICFDIVESHRRARYQAAAMSSLLQTGGGVPRAVSAFKGLLANGADSVAIARVDVTIPLVCKMAHHDVISQEAAYMQEINRLLDDAGRAPLFPRIVSVVTDEDPAWYLMEAADPRSLDQLVFSDSERTVVNADGLPLLERALDKLAQLYDLTFASERAAVSPYHYLGRFRTVPQRADTAQAFAAAVGGSLDDMLGRHVILDGGFRCRSYTEQLRMLEAHLDDLVQPVAAHIHGDAHLPNMLLLDGDVCFVDPRSVWDGTDVGAPGIADPVYDLATLLHSLHVMSAILRAVAVDATDVLLDLAVDEHAIDVRGGVLRLHDNPTVAWFQGWIADRMGADLLGARWRARLHVSTANALVGWLKFARSLPTEGAWMAVFVSALYHLEVAARELEEGTP